MKSIATVLTAVLLVFATIGLASAQEPGAITGTVIDAETGEPLPGATVYLPTVDRGATTNPDGIYRVTNVPPGNHRVRISYIGYREHETRIDVAAGAEVTYDVALQTDILGLDAIVVTGYGVARKRDVIGSISQVRARDIEIQPILSADQALQGRASGVRVVGTSGEPGGGFEIQVRGVGSITAGTQPLYVVDGVPINAQRDISTQASTNPLAAIRSSDIESIEVLKDAAAASIYGAQAANGVVLITTRRGITGRTQIRFESRVGQVDHTQTFDLLASDEWLRLNQEAWGNRAVHQPFSAGGQNWTTYERGGEYFVRTYVLPHIFEGPGEYPNPERRAQLRQEWLAAYLANPNNPPALPTYDWQGEAMQTGLLNEYALTARGGTDRTRFFVSAAYDFREGQYIRSDFRRYSIRGNLDHQATERLTLQSNISLAHQSQQGSIRDGNFINGVLFGAPLVAPNIPVSLPDGEFYEGWRFGNPIGAVSVEDRFTNVLRLLTNVAANLELSHNLFLRTNVGVDYGGYRDRNHRPGIAYYENNDSGFEAHREVINLNINPVLNYTTTFNGMHNVSSLVGAEYRREYRDQHGVSVRDFPSPLFRRITAAATNVSWFGASSEYRIAGTFGRVDYNYDNRYYATATLRYDGSSRFGADTRWGLFYAASLGWDVSREGFMENVRWIDQLQPRISYGTTGNADVDPSAWIADFAARGLYGATTPYVGAAGLRPTQLANPILTWEEAATFNVGFDAQLFNGRLSTSVEFFRTENSSLLLARELPIDAGFGSIRENVGRVLNSGFEFEMSSVNLDYRGFRWMTDFNITFAQNEVLELVDDQETFGSGTGSGEVPGTIFVGQPIHVYYMPRYAGVNPADGRPMWFDRDGNITYYPDITADAQIVGSPYSDFWGGFNNRLSYGGFSIDAFFQFDFGSDTFKQQQTFFYETPQWFGNMTRNQLRRWQQPGDITDVPMMYSTGIIPGAQEARNTSSRHVVDRSYLRLKQLRAAYEIPRGWAEQMQLQRLSIYAQGYNLITWTGYDGMDPEIHSVAAGYFPQPRSMMMGIVVDF